MLTGTNRVKTPVSFPKDPDEWHAFLEGNVETAIKIREYVEELPETAATFQLADIDGVELQPKTPASLVKLTGAWPAPDLFTNTGSAKWVNPSYVHAQHYSDAVVECGCGIPVLRQSFGDGEPQPAHHQEHADDCNKIHRMQAQLQLLKNRRDIIRDAYAHGHTATGVSQRLGYPDSYHIGGGEAQELGLDLGALARESRRRMARTCMVLCREFDPETVGEVYGAHRRSVSEMLNKETVTTSKRLWSARCATDRVSAD